MLLLAAVGATLARLKLPEISRYHAAIEEQINRHSDYPLRARAIEADWRGWTPRLTLRGVALLDRGGGRKIIDFEQAAVEIAPLQSLLQRRFVPARLVVSGAQLAVTYRPDGGFSIAGINMPAPRDGGLGDWLLRQGNLALRDARIEWIDAKHGQAPLPLSAVELRLRADGERAQVDGSCKLPGEYAQSLRFAIDAAGDLSAAAWNGSLYLRLDAVRPDNWYRHYYYSAYYSALPRPALLEEGAVFEAVSGAGETDIELWGHWREARLRRIDGRLSHRDFIVRAAAQDGDGPLPVAELGYSFSARRVQEQDAPQQDWRVRLRLDRLETENGDWPLTRLEGEVRAQWRNTREGSNGQQGSNVQQENTPQWWLRTDSLTVGDADHTITLRGEMHNHNADGRAQLRLYADLATDRLDRLHRLAPGTDNFRLRQWLQRTMQGGNITSARFAWRGHPADFPFRHGEGRLRGRLEMSEVAFKYAPEWPRAEALDAAIEIENATLTATLAEGKLFDADLRPGGAVRVPDLTQRPRQIDVQGSLSGRSDALTDFIRASPLRRHDILGPLADNIIDGGILAEAEMSLGARRGLAGSLKLADATLSAHNGQLRLERVTGLARFTRDSITADGLAAELVTGAARQPVSLRIAGPGGEPGRLGAVTVVGDADRGFIAKQLRARLPRWRRISSPLLRRLQGDLGWRAEIAYFRGEGQEARQRQNGGVKQRLTLSSNLHGMSIDLPPPLGKSAWQKKIVVMEKTLGEAGETRLRYDDRIAVVFAPPATRQQTAQKATQKARQSQDTPDTKRGGDLGDSGDSGAIDIAAAPDRSGLLVSGDIEVLSFQHWADTFKTFSRAAAKRSGLIDNDIHLDLRIADLDFYHQRFADMHVEAARSRGAWRLNTSSPDLSGAIVLPTGADGVIKADLERLALDYTPGEGIAALKPDPRRLPTLDLRAQDFVFGGLPLGALELVTSRADKGLTIERLRLSKPGLNIVAQGAWSGIAAAQRSSFKADLQAKKTSLMLETFGYDGSPIKKGKTKMTFSAAWPGAPMDFSLANINGELKLRLSKGRIMEVDPAAGRLFGLLSLQTLPRRLSLDFTDLLGKGLAFDKIEGDFDLSEGNAYTNNLQMTGPAANVAVSGRTGLIEQDYDQIATVTPQVADNLPVAGALFGPVGIGIGAMLYLAGNVFTSINNSINNILSYQYTINGSWQDPQVEKIKLQDGEALEKSRLSRRADAVEP